MSFEKSGLKRNFTPSEAPGRVRERIQSIIIRIKRPGINILEYFSIPSFMPATTMRAVRARKTSIIIAGLIGDDINSPKNDASAVLSEAKKLVEKDLRIYSIAHPPTTK